VYILKAGSPNRNYAKQVTEGRGRVTYFGFLGPGCIPGMAEARAPSAGSVCGAFFG